MMLMYFYWTTQVYFLLPGWESTTPGGLVFGLFCTFLFTLIPHFLTRVKKLMTTPKSDQLTKDDSHALNDSTTSEKKKEFSSHTRLMVTLIYFVQAFCGGAIMLLFMTMNGWVFITIILAMTTGYFMFESKDDFGLTSSAGQCHI